MNVPEALSAGRRAAVRLGPRERARDLSDEKHAATSFELSDCAMGVGAGAVIASFSSTSGATLALGSLLGLFSLLMAVSIPIAGRRVRYATSDANCGRACVTLGLISLAADTTPLLVFGFWATLARP